MNLVQHLAMVPESDGIVPLKQLMRVSSALQKQVARDLDPIWSVRATVDAFPSLEDVPGGYWPVVVVEDVEDAAGVHLDKNGQPFALVEIGTSWSLTASHEVLEMLVDPFGDRLVSSASIKPKQGRVEYLVEVCDPSEAEDFAYTVNGVLVSDFYTPSFFDPVASTGVRYSFGGHIQKPRQVLKGGYLSWHDPISDHWFQQTWFSGAHPTFRDLGVFQADDARSIREIVDSLTPQMRRIGKIPAKSRALAGASETAHGIELSSRASAANLREQLRMIRQGKALSSKSRR